MPTEDRIGRRPHVLVVADDLALRILLALTLEEAGYAPTAVAGVVRALDRLADGGTDLVLTDLVMPRRSGIELLAALRTVAPETPAIAMSGSTDEGLRRVALALGARDVLAKPLRVEILLAAVDDALRAATKAAA
jgi:CheY-like chemotaxis protein